MKFNIRYPRFGNNYTISASETDEAHEYEYSIYLHHINNRWTVDQVIIESGWGTGWHWLPKTWFFTEKVTERG